MVVARARVMSQAGVRAYRPRQRAWTPHGGVAGVDGRRSPRAILHHFRTMLRGNNVYRFLVHLHPFWERPGSPIRLARTAMAAFQHPSGQGRSQNGPKPLAEPRVICAVQ